MSCLYVFDFLYSGCLVMPQTAWGDSTSEALILWSSTQTLKSFAFHRSMLWATVRKFCLSMMEPRQHRLYPDTFWRSRWSVFIRISPTYQHLNLHLWQHRPIRYNIRKREKSQKEQNAEWDWIYFLDMGPTNSTNGLEGKFPVGLPSLCLSPSPVSRLPLPVSRSSHQGVDQVVRPGGELPLLLRRMLMRSTPWGKTNPSTSPLNNSRRCLSTWLLLNN